MRQNFSLHENYRDDEPTKLGSDRAFGCTVGAILMVIGAGRAFAVGTFSPVTCLILVAGALLLLLGVLAPARLAVLNRLWSKLGGLMAKVINPIVLMLLFFLVVTPMAFVMRVAGKRPLRLYSDRAASSYWIRREIPQGKPTSMTQQF